MNRELLIKALSFLTSIGLAITGYFLADTYAKMDGMRKDITELQISSERVIASRFSSSDFVKAKEIIDSQIVATDKRVIALEESQKTIKEYLYEMRADIKDIKNQR
jgi:hypothetical protein